MYPTPCFHIAAQGLCDACKADQEIDPEAWEEFGNHPAGRENWRRL